MKKKRQEERVITKKEACYLLRIQLKDLGLFERTAKISTQKESYTDKEFLRLSRSAVNFQG